MQITFVVVLTYSQDLSDNDGKHGECGSLKNASHSSQEEQGPLLGIQLQHLPKWHLWNGSIVLFYLTREGACTKCAVSCNTTVRPMHTYHSHVLMLTSRVHGTFSVSGFSSNVSCSDSPPSLVSCRTRTDGLDRRVDCLFNTGLESGLLFCLGVLYSTIVFSSKISRCPSVCEVTRSK